MQLIIKKGILGILLFTAALMCAFPVSSAWAQIGGDPGKEVEITKVDLFSLPGWEHRQVAVNSFVLGMTRAQTFEIAEANKLKLRSDLPPRKAREVKVPCRAASCSVLQVDGNCIGVNLFFDVDRLAKIKVSVPVDADPEVKKANIARKFKGRTYQFFNHYSDDLQNEIFGPAEGKKKPVRAGAQIANLMKVEYEYLHLGLIICVTIDERDRPPNPFDLEVDFVAPH